MEQATNSSGSIDEIAAANMRSGRRDVIETHARLMANQRDQIAHRKDLLANLRDLEQGVIGEDGFLSWVRRAPAPVRARIAMRTATRTMISKGAETSTPDRILKDELAFVESRLRFTDVQLKKLEEQVLASKPIDATDARIVKRFVDELKHSGRRLRDKQRTELKTLRSNVSFAPARSARLVLGDADLA
jgi:hypothetical protein